ncbi:hypothetical protein A2V56_00490 [Candidatus Woesebacteria bacterium RBG_19FT_COMBO_42_9]|uniref:Major facilitator superfamily (MFS) profile domain-containing protein n=1 Tax=Candidatus Woesebacteria bacterium RBG_16_42_24 TaxID=1802485 RepID=A0A1F7XJE3_9BACT|nr:MAG: hypothetical protein A2V97_00130 [Candidatus Woesebacteria bacterium RBG_16_42_24]OGM17475.1 MAG: hypothetical protein A2V56_00490 [Candidatus Woesebacteria bacterium RBG_19FT_COMBO_42_9]OGM67124.1 MAG: hypothetical protein A2985_02650 [Candidatus Woesebacteria bacterium RIFCSPLOWO2_01_FULL_43_11]
MLKEFRPVVKNSKFLYLWISQIFSQITINLTNFVLLIKLFSTTGSSIATSLLWVSYALPAIVVGPFGAAIVDMVDRRSVLIITNLLQSLVIFLYALNYTKGIFLLYGATVGYAFLNQFYVPAEAASLPSLVEKKHLPFANSLFFMTQQGSIIVGFLTAGILNHLLGFATTLFVASFFLFLAFVSVSLLPKIQPSEELPVRFEEGIVNFFERIFQGYKFIKENRHVLVPFLFLLGFQITMATILINTPLIVVDIFRFNLNSGIIFIVISAVLGAVTGSLLISKLLRRGFRKKLVIENSLLLLSLSLLFFTFLVPELGIIMKTLIGGGAIFLAGFSAIGIVIPSQTFLQENTPGGLRGRVFGNFWFLATIATVFPVLFSGAVSELFGVRLLLFVFVTLTFSAFFFSRNYGDKFLTNKESV